MSSVHILVESEPLNASENKFKSPSHCWRWVSVCSFLLLAGATVFLALQYFHIISFAENKEEFKMPEILAVRSYLDSVPPEVSGQDKAGKKTAAHCPGQLENGKLIWDESALMNSESEDEKVKLEDNSLVIPRDGLYFVYTQVAFTGPNCQGKNALYLTHTVNKWSPSYEEVVPILTTTKSVCEVPSNSAWFQPIYQGGLFHLEKGDVLSTDTTELNNLYEEDGQIYFGVFAI
ncbi:tumor necrosis factor-like [Discoglossus pictus]